jgi:hypothetical protein
MRRNRKIYEEQKYKWVTKAASSIHCFLKTKIETDNLGL